MNRFQRFVLLALLIVVGSCNKEKTPPATSDALENIQQVSPNFYKTTAPSSRLPAVGCRPSFRATEAFPTRRRKLLFYYDERGRTRPGTQPSSRTSTHLPVLQRPVQIYFQILRLSELRQLCIPLCYCPFSRRRNGRANFHFL